MQTSAINIANFYLLEEEKLFSLLNDIFLLIKNKIINVNIFLIIASIGVIGINSPKQPQLSLSPEKIDMKDLNCKN